MMDDTSTPIKLNALFLPSRELYAVELIESLSMIELTFNSCMSIDRMMNEMIKYINREENFELKLRVLLDDKANVPTMKLYRNSFKMEIDQIKRVLIENNSKISNGQTIELIGFFDFLEPDQTLQQENINNNDIIICEYYVSSSLFSSSQKKKNQTEHSHFPVMNPLCMNPLLNNFIQNFNDLQQQNDYESNIPLMYNTNPMQENIAELNSFDILNPLAQLLQMKMKQKEINQNFLRFMSSYQNSLEKGIQNKQEFDPTLLVEVLKKNLLSGNSDPKHLLQEIEKLPEKEKEHPILLFLINQIKLLIENRGKENELKQSIDNQFQNDIIADRIKHYGSLFNQNQDTEDIIMSHTEEINQNKPFKHTLIGLSNLTNTCYINATVQCLLCCEELSNYFFSNEYKSDLTSNPDYKPYLINEYANLIKALMRQTNTAYRPINFVNCFKTLFTQFNNVNQHDMEEFFSILIDYFKEGLNKEKSSVHHLFNGLFKYSIQCSVCNTLTIQNEPFITISVPLEKYYSSSIVCYFYFNNCHTKPLKFNIDIAKGLTLNDLNEHLAKVLTCPIDAFEICAKSNGKFIDITEEKGKLVESIDSNAKLCFIVLNYDLFKISIIKLNRMFSGLKENKSTNELRAKELNMRQTQKITTKAIDNKKFIKVILFQHKYSIDSNGNKEPINVVPHLLYIFVELTYEQLYDYLINHYSWLFDDKREKLFTQKNIPQCKFDCNKTKLKDPFVILFETIQSSGTLSDSSKSFLQNLLLPWDNQKVLQSLLKENQEKDSLEGDDYSQLECLLSIIWNPIYVPKLLSIDNAEPINIPSFRSKLNLDECFQRFFKLEQLTTDNKVDCSKCQLKQTVDKQIKIINAPKILVIHFKRLHKEQKIDTLISFPLENLNINDYLSNDCPEKDNSLYDLFAVGYHSGNFSFGHYYSCIKHKADNNWYKISDEIIEKVSDESKIVSFEAYILFYKQKASKTE